MEEQLRHRISGRILNFTGLVIEFVFKVSFFTPTTKICIDQTMAEKSEQRRNDNSL